MYMLYTGKNPGVVTNRYCKRNCY